MIMDKVLGVVLCGGESRRMGRDKGLIEQDGRTWAARAGAVLAAQLIPVVFSVRTAQLKQYRDQLPQAVCVPDSVSIPGPLNGLLSVHRRCPDRNLLVLACDQVCMDTPTVHRLLEAYRTIDTECYAYRLEDEAEPFCALYTSALLQRWSEKAAQGLLTRYNLKQLAEEGPTHWLRASERKAFFNANRPEDEQQVLSLWKRAS